MEFDPDLRKRISAAIWRDPTPPVPTGAGHSLTRRCVARILGVELPLRPLSDRPARRRNYTAGRIMIAVVAACLLVTTGMSWWLLKSTSGVVSTVGSDYSPHPIDESTDENILIVGREKGGAGAIAVVHISADGDQVVVISFAPDLIARQGQCAPFDGSLRMIYQAGGMSCLMTGIQRISGLEITGFATLLPGGFRELVDAVDGVEVCDQGRPTILDGAQSTRYLQEGIDRLARQNEFMAGFLRKTFAANILGDPRKLAALSQKFSDVTADSTLRIEKIVHVARVINAAGPQRIRFVSAVGTQQDDALFKAVMGNTPLPGGGRTLAAMACG